MQLVCPACGTRNRLPDERLHDDPRCGRCKSALMAPQPVALDDSRFPAFIAGTELPVLVDYWATWCGPCRAMAPQFVAAAAQLPEVRLVKVDTDASPQASAAAGIRGIPTLLLYARGKEVARRSGAASAADIVGWTRAQLRTASG